MGPTWVLSAPDGSHAGPTNLAIWDMTRSRTPCVWSPWVALYCQHLFSVTTVRTFIYFVIMVVQGAINIHSDAITCRGSPHYRPFRKGIWLALTLMLRHTDVPCHFPKVHHHILYITPYVLCCVLLCLDTGRFQKYVYLSRLLYLHLGHLTLKNPYSTWCNHSPLTTQHFNGQTVFRQERRKIWRGLSDV